MTNMKQFISSFIDELVIIINILVLRILGLLIVC